MTIRFKLAAALLPALMACLCARAQAKEALTYGKVDAMTQALNTCLSCNYDGNTRGGDVSAVAVGKGWGSGKRGVITAGRNFIKGTRKVLVNLRPAKPVPAPEPAPEPEYGPLKPRPKEDKPDPNRWNPAIEGANGAFVFGLVGMILGGPAGLIIGAIIGFAMMYYGRKHNDR